MSRFTAWELFLVSIWGDMKSFASQNRPVMFSARERFQISYFPVYLNLVSVVKLLCVLCIFSIDKGSNSLSLQFRGVKVNIIKDVNKRILLFPSHNNWFLIHNNNNFFANLFDSLFLLLFFLFVF